MKNEKETWIWLRNNTEQTNQLVERLGLPLMMRLADETDSLRRKVLEEESIVTIEESLEEQIDWLTGAFSQEISRRGLHPMFIGLVQDNLAKYRDLQDFCLRSSCIRTVTEELIKNKVTYNDLEGRIYDFILFAESNYLFRGQLENGKEIKLNMALRIARGFLRDVEKFIGLDKKGLKKANNNVYIERER